jgi:hypothetical protein
MKTYPSIPKDIIYGLSYYVFDKLDGSNIRAEWSRKKGFYKFGSRKRLTDENDILLGKAPDLIRVKYEKDLTDIFKKQRYERAICFFEFWGPSSFAGNHNLSEQHDITLFDVNPYKKGILEPKEYLKIFGHLDIAKLLYHGKVNKEFVESVKNGELDGMTFEGVIGKAKNPKKTPLPIMFKAKNLAWIEKLKNFCGDDAKLFQQLL